MKYRTALFLGAAMVASVTAAHADPVFGGGDLNILTPSAGCPGASGGLVANAGFECYETEEISGPETIFVDFPGWAFNLDQDGHGVVFDPNSHTGDAAALLDNDIYAGANLSQLIATVAGQAYKIDFWYRDPPGAPSITVKRTGTSLSPGDCEKAGHHDGKLTASFGSTQLLQTGHTQAADGCFDANPVPGWTELTAYALGTGSDLLSFDYDTDLGGSWFLDDVSIVAVDSIPIDQSPSTGVPEPASVGLVIAGLAGLGALRRRRTISARVRRG